jgi:hypothetical protein
LGRTDAGDRSLSPSRGRGRQICSAATLPFEIHVVPRVTAHFQFIACWRTSMSFSGGKIRFDSNPNTRKIDGPEMKQDRKSREQFIRKQQERSDCRALSVH